VLGTVTRLSPIQATVSITVVDGIPLLPGEEFTGVIRVQDVRATDKDRVKMGDCFRGGDVVKGVVVRIQARCLQAFIDDSIRFHWVMPRATTSPLLGTTLV
jgi:exosome complex RNA-binding protein Csl4